MKYIVTIEREFGPESIYIFPKTVNHSDFFRALQHGVGGGLDLVSAGMVNPTTGWVSMGSVTLRINRDLAREKLDEELLQFHANL